MFIKHASEFSGSIGEAEDAASRRKARVDARDGRNADERLDFALVFSRIKQLAMTFGQKARQLRSRPLIRRRSEKNEPSADVEPQIKVGG